MRSAIRHRHSWLTAKDVRTARVPTSLRTFFRHRKLGCITRGITVGSAPNEKTVPQSCVLSCSQAVHGRYGKGRHGLRRFARNDEREFLHATNWHDGQINKSLSISPRECGPMPSRGPGEQNMAKSFLGKINNVVAVARETLGIAGRYMVKVPSGGSRGGGLASSSGVTNRSRRGTSSRALGRSEAQGSVRLFQPFGV